MAPNRPNKHHYIPEFYLKKWCAEDGKLCQFSKPYGGIFRARRVYPAETAFQKRLYTLNGFPEEIAHQVEERFFSQVDSQAAEVLSKLHKRDLNLTNRERSAWTRFLMSLLLRMPEDVEHLRIISRKRFTETSEEDEARYNEIRREGDPQTFSEFMAQMSDREVDQAIFPTFMDMIDSPQVGNYINGMTWMLKDFNEVKHRFLTSDRPIIITNGIANPHGHIALPIGPKLLFVAANTREVAKNIIVSNAREVMQQVNDQVACHAVKFAYSTNDREKRFVEKRISTVRQRRLIQLDR